MANDWTYCLNVDKEVIWSYLFTQQLVDCWPRWMNVYAGTLYGTLHSCSALDLIMQSWVGSCVLIDSQYWIVGHSPMAYTACGWHSYVPPFLWIIGSLKQECVLCYYQTLVLTTYLFVGTGSVWFVLVLQCYWLSGRSTFQCYRNSGVSLWAKPYGLLRYVWADNFHLNFNWNIQPRWFVCLLLISSQHFPHCDKYFCFV